MNHTPAGLRAATMLLCLLALPFSQAAAAGLTDLLVGKVGVTPPQAEGGAGSIFRLAKSQLTAENFAKVKSAVPGMDRYLAAAPAPTPIPTAATTPAAASGGTLSGLAAKALAGSAATGTAGSLGNKLQTLQQLAPAFEQLGMKSKLVGKFVPVVVDYVKASGGSATAKLLTGALGF